MILIVLTYLAGVLTILSPCILPVLPFIFSRSQNSFLRSHLPLLAGMCVTFSLFSALAVVGGDWLSQANEIGRVIAMLLLTIFGLSLIFPVIAERALEPVAQWGSKISQSSERDSLGGSFVIGISTGLLWAPCAGPILGLVLTGAAAQGDIAKSMGLLASYSLGAATSLSLALVAGNKFLDALKKFLGVDKVVKRVLGIAVLMGVMVIALNLDRTILTRISALSTVQLENKLLAILDPNNKMTPEEPKTSGPMPELTGVSSWLNSPPLMKFALRDKVVLIDFWTYSCINCLRSLPYVKVWAEKYKSNGLVVIGVHTPEFAFERKISNVKKAVEDLGITYPVAIDNDYNIWNALGNSYWPAHYFIDRRGIIRHYNYGEGDYEKSEQVIRNLLSKNGNDLNTDNTLVIAKGVQAPSSTIKVTSPETYLGLDHAKNQIQNYQGAGLNLNQWALVGSWIQNNERAFLESAPGKIIYRFKGRDLHLVLGSTKIVKFKVLLDDKAPDGNKGLDIDSHGYGEVQAHRLYQLLRLENADDSDEHTFEIEFLDSGVEAYAFTFG